MVQKGINVSTSIFSKWMSEMAESIGLVGNYMNKSLRAMTTSRIIAQGLSTDVI